MAVISGTKARRAAQRTVGDSLQEYSDGHGDNGGNNHPDED